VTVNDKCNIRDTMLRESSEIEVPPNENCTVDYGKWLDPYSGQTFEGDPSGGADGTANDLDIDHIIPLKYVNNHGGSNWSNDQKKEYGNSVQAMNNGLYVVSGASANRKKGDQGPAEWMPSNADYQCTYATKWRDIALSWHISLDPTDYDYLNQKLEDCKK
jgi:hypothetical protein